MTEDQLLRRVASLMWSADGRPERDAADPTTIGKSDYEYWTGRVFRALKESGYPVVHGETLHESLRRELRP